MSMEEVRCTTYALILMVYATLTAGGEEVYVREKRLLPMPPIMSCSML